MDLDRNYFAEETEKPDQIGLASPATPTFGNPTMPPWYLREAYPADNVYQSPDGYAEEAEDYFTNGENYSWSSGGDAAVTTSPITSISSFSTCISPTAISFDHEAANTTTTGVPASAGLQQHGTTYAQWSVSDWQPTFEGDDLGTSLSPGTSYDVIQPPPPKKQKNKASSPYSTSTSSSVSSTSHRHHHQHGQQSQKYHRGSKRSSKSTAAILLPPPPPSPPSLKIETPPSPPKNPPERISQLRTASRKAKRTSAHKPAASEEERKARASHNLVEKQYRNRLNAQFERLLAVLPPPGSDDDDGGGCEDLGGDGMSGAGGDRRLSKAEVLDIARRRIKTLERERDSLKVQKRELNGSVSSLREAILRQRREG